MIQRLSLYEVVKYGSGLVAYMIIMSHAYFSTCVV